jgi:hypothetical protein
MLDVFEKTPMQQKPIARGAVIPEAYAPDRRSANGGVGQPSSGIPSPAPPTREIPGGFRPSYDEHYREIAGKLLEIAREVRFAGARKEILQLAVKYERRAAYFDWRSAALKDRGHGDEGSPS